MNATGATYIAPSTARRALIDLVADIAWAARDGRLDRTQQRARNEAMELLVRIDRGEREATRRGMQLVDAAHERQSY